MQSVLPTSPYSNVLRLLVFLTLLLYCSSVDEENKQINYRPYLNRRRQPTKLKTQQLEEDHSSSGSSESHEHQPTRSKHSSNQYPSDDPDVKQSNPRVRRPQQNYGNKYNKGHDSDSTKSKDFRDSSYRGRKGYKSHTEYEKTKGKKYGYGSIGSIKDDDGDYSRYRGSEHDGHTGQTHHGSHGHYRNNGYDQPYVKYQPSTPRQVYQPSTRQVYQPVPQQVYQPAREFYQQPSEPVLTQPVYQRGFRPSRGYVLGSNGGDYGLLRGPLADAFFAGYNPHAPMDKGGFYPKYFQSTY